MSDQDTNKTIPGTETAVSEAEINAWKEKAALAETLMAEKQAREEQARNWGFDTVDEMDEYLRESAELRDRAELEGKVPEPVKPPVKPDNKPPVSQPQPRSDSDALVLENYLKTEWLSYKMDKSEEERKSLNEKDMRAIFNKNRALIIEHTKSTGNIWSAVEDYINLSEGKKRAADAAVASEKAKNAAEASASTTTGMVVNEPKPLTDFEKAQEAKRRSIAPVTYKPPA